MRNCFQDILEERQLSTFLDSHIQ
uniref:Uncharacterized protein n=1 Tax=Arundo donax TaxID=35708 RepID=A0A0A9DSW5_ARUDO